MKSFFFTKVLLFLFVAVSIQAAQKDFALTYQENIYGNIKMIGNTVLQVEADRNTVNNDNFISDDQVTWGNRIINGEVRRIYSGGSWGNIDFQANNFSYVEYTNVDPAAGIFNSSSSTLSLPDGARVVYARLYWTGLVHNFQGVAIGTRKDDSKKVKIKISAIDLGNGPGAYTDIEVTKDDDFDDDEGWADIPFNMSTGDFTMYSAYKNIDLSAYEFDGTPLTVTVANVASEEGWMRNYGNFGAWSLAVIYEHTDESFKNISLFTGYKQVYQNPEEFEITGFVTPMEGEVLATLSFFAAEGELTLRFGNDFLKVTDSDGAFFDITNNATYPNARNNIFDSTITNNETRTPSVVNNMGIDIDTFDIGKDGDMTHPQIIDNLQTSTTIRATSGGDAYYLNAMAIGTELFTPDLCYDYAYQQQGQYFTEENTGLVPPNVKGTVITNEDIQVKVYIRNTMTSDVILQNVSIDIGMDEDQATYIRETTELANRSSTPVDISDSSMSVSDSFIKDIDIGEMNANDYFYLYYHINPKVSDLDMPLDVTINYDLEVDGTILNDDTLSAQLGKGSKKIPMCTASNFNYQPAKGIFTVVHNDYYNAANTFYNLPTQVTRREGNFKVISLDPNDLDTLKNVATLVGVEMIDAGIYHDTNASCAEQDATITPKAWVTLLDSSSTENKTTQTDFTQAAIRGAIARGRVEAPTKTTIPALTNVNDSPLYYSIARQNAAFRITYDIHPETGDIVQLELLEDNNVTRFNVANFPDLASTHCLANAGAGISDTELLQDYCTDSASFEDAMSFNTLQTCIQCAYGGTKRYVCSRDNFAIRPEAFKLKLDDQSQASPNQQQTLVNQSGRAIINTYDGNLTAGYKYNLEAVATTHIDNNASFGYTKSLTAIDNEYSRYAWQTEPTAGACNDLDHKPSPVRFFNGNVDTNTSVEQVGDYKLQMLDKTWTAVDHDSNYRDHHNNVYFFQGTDCVEDNSNTYTINQPINFTTGTNLVGCDINSTHTAPATNLEFIDYDVRFHPFKIDTSLVSLRTGINNAMANANDYVYANDLNSTTAADYNATMASRYVGWIQAVGYDNSVLSNFVTDCYAEDLNISLGNLNIEGVDGNNSKIAYQYKFHVHDENASLINSEEISNYDVDAGIVSLGVQSSSMIQALNGAINFTLNLNYDKTPNNPMNPKIIAYPPRFDNVSCLTTNNCNFQVFNPNTSGFGIMNTQAINITEAEASLTPMAVPDINITHYFARSLTPRQSYTELTGIAPIYYEVYCNVNSGCNTGLLQSTQTSKSGDSRWRINTSHTSNEGSVPNITQKNAVNTTASATSLTSTTLTYDDSRGRPYTATMQHLPNSWLVYNPYNANATTNEFEAEFIGGNSNWAGKTKTNDTTQTDGAQRTNRRIQW